MRDPSWDKDPCIVALRKKYPKKGPDPKHGQSLDEWADHFTDGIQASLERAGRLIHQKVPIEDICKQTGLRRETIESYYSGQLKKNKKGE